MNYQYIPSFTYNTNYYDPLTSYNSQGLSSTTPTATYNPSFLTTPSPSLSLSSFTTSPSPSNQTTNGLYSTQTLFPQHMGLTTAFPNNLSAPPVNHTAYTGLSSLNPTPTSANYNSFFNPPTPVSSTTSFYSPSSYSLQSSLNTTPTNQSTYYNNLTPSIRSPSFTWPRLRTRSIRSNSFSNNFNNNSFDLTNYQMNGIGMGSNTILLLTLLPEHANLNTRYEPTAEEIQDNMQSKLGRLIDEIDENGNNNYDFNSQKHILLPTVEEVESLFRPYGEVKKIIIFNKNGLFKSLIQMSSVDVAMNAKLFLDGIIFRSSINDYCYGKIRIGFSTMNELQVSPMAVQLRKAKDYTNQRLLYNTMSHEGDNDMIEPGDGSGRVVLVTNLPTDLNADHLYNLFSLYGKVERVKICYNKRDTALIQFSNSSNAQKAISMLHNIPVYNEIIHVIPSKHDKVTFPSHPEAQHKKLTKDYTNIKDENEENGNHLINGNNHHTNGVSNEEQNGENNEEKNGCNENSLLKNFDSFHINNHNNGNNDDKLDGITSVPQPSCSLLLVVPCVKTQKEIEELFAAEHPINVEMLPGAENEDDSLWTSCVIEFSNLSQSIIAFLNHQHQLCNNSILHLTFTLDKNNKQQQQQLNQ